MKLEIKIGHSTYIIDFKEKQLLDLSHQPVKGARTLLSEYLSQEKIVEPKNTNNHTYIGLIKKHLNVKKETEKSDKSIKKEDTLGKIVFSNKELIIEQFKHHTKTCKTDINKLIQNVAELISSNDRFSIHKSLFTPENKYNSYIKQNIPSKPGVYLWYNKYNNEIIYIGMAGKIKTNGELTDHPISKRLQAPRCKDILTKKEIYSNLFVKAILDVFNIEDIEFIILTCKENEPAAHIESILLYNYFKQHKVLPILNNAY